MLLLHGEVVAGGGPRGEECFLDAHQEHHRKMQPLGGMGLSSGRPVVYASRLVRSFLTSAPPDPGGVRRRLALALPPGSAFVTAKPSWRPPGAYGDPPAGARPRRSPPVSSGALGSRFGRRIAEPPQAARWGPRGRGIEQAEKVGGRACAFVLLRPPRRRCAGPRGEPDPAAQRGPGAMERRLADARAGLLTMRRSATPLGFTIRRR